MINTEAKLIDRNIYTGTWYVYRIGETKLSNLYSFGQFWTNTEFTSVNTKNWLNNYGKKDKPNLMNTEEPQKKLTFNHIH